MVKVYLDQPAEREVRGRVREYPHRKDIGFLKFLSEGLSQLFVESRWQSFLIYNLVSNIAFDFNSLITRVNLVVLKKVHLNGRFV